jgi:hypothetical protein
MYGYGSNKIALTDLTGLVVQKAHTVPKFQKVSEERDNL